MVRSLTPMRETWKKSWAPGQAAGSAQAITIMLEVNQWAENLHLSLK